MHLLSLLRLGRGLLRCTEQVQVGCLGLEVLRENLYLGDVGLVSISLRRPEFWAMTLACYFLVFPLFALTIFTDFVWLVRFI